MLILKLLKRHARNRVHQEKARANGASNTISGPDNNSISSETNSTGGGVAYTETSANRGPVENLGVTQNRNQNQIGHKSAEQTFTRTPLDLSDGVYRVPESKRFITGGSTNNRPYEQTKQPAFPPTSSFTPTNRSQRSQIGAYVGTQGIRPLYC